MSSRLRVLHVIACFYPATRYGGPTESVFRLCKALQGEGVEVSLATTNTDGDGDLDVPIGRATDLDGVPVSYFRRSPRNNFVFSAGLLEYLMRSRGRYDLWHVTGVFDFPSTAAAAVARLSGVPYVLSPRGSLRPWSRRHGAWKKLPYWHLAARANAARAGALHATSDFEREELEATLPRSRVFTIPNGIDLAPPAEVPRAPRQIVFVGRLHAVKGFDVLVPALGLVAERMPEVETIVAGPDDHGEWARIEERLARTSPRPRVRYVGALDAEERDRLMAGATALVLTSHSENFGQVVLEAMAAGTPVVVSRNCPWRSVEEEGAGAWVENTPERVAAALLSILENPERAAAMGQAGRRLSARFTWSAVGARMAEEYAAVVAASRPVARPTSRG